MMFSRMRRTLQALAVACGLSAVFSASLAGLALAEKNDLAAVLSRGGFVIVVRHGATFPDQADTDPLNFDNIAAQRNLNDKGKALAKAFGESLRLARIPVGKVYTSQYNRAYETAVLAGFKDIEKTADLTEGGLIVSPNENKRRSEAFRRILSAAPRPGANISSMPSARIGSTSKRARPRSSVPKTKATSWWPGFRWRNGRR
jgi:hypothetical protein